MIRLVRYFVAVLVCVLVGGVPAAANALPSADVAAISAKAPQSGPTRAVLGGLPVQVYAYDGSRSLPSTPGAVSDTEPGRVEVGRLLGGSVVVSDSGVAAKAAPEGVIYRRTDLLGGKPYVGQAKNEDRYLARQSEHARANPDADFEFEIIGRGNPGTELDRMEEFFIRQGGGPTNKGNPFGGLANGRHQMSDLRYLMFGGDPW